VCVPIPQLNRDSHLEHLFAISSLFTFVLTKDQTFYQN